MITQAFLSEDLLNPINHAWAIPLKQQLLLKVCLQGLSDLMTKVLIRARLLLLSTLSLQSAFLNFLVGSSALLCEIFLGREITIVF